MTTQRMDEGTNPETVRRNRLVLGLIGGLVVLGVALPMAWSALEQPHARYDTFARARAAGAVALLPRRTPPSAREIREKHFADADHRWVRFVYDPADEAAMLAGLTPLDTVAVKRLSIPSPGWTPWWLINQGTLDSKQARWLRFYRAEDGWMAVDPRTHVAYFWTP
ncbi:MAG: hypothetical protein JWM27_4223 [Gemmatimonadetes bacterium]|nr:hypothetical protein [Gemmatimonadota bacterium]